MKKTIILFGFIGFCSIGFSQTTISNNNNNSTATDVKTVVVNKANLKPVRIGEKIQTTVEGVVKHSKTYKPQYPVSMIDPEKQPIKNNNQLLNN
jgi:hypothetical protein